MAVTRRRLTEYPRLVPAVVLALIAVLAIGAWSMPRGSVLISWIVAVAIIGAAAYLMWRRFYARKPFEEHPEETLHLRDEG